jgi:hypothetical protein
MIRSHRDRPGYNNVYTPKFQVICLFQRWINVSYINYYHFLRTGLDYIAEKVSDVKSHDEGPFIAITDSISGFVHRPNLEHVEMYF